MGTSKAQRSSVGCEVGAGRGCFTLILKNYFKFSLLWKNSNTQSRKNSKMNFHVTLLLLRNPPAAVVSDSMRPHRWQPTRLRHPWDSPGKNTGVGCHFLLQCMKVKSDSEVAQSCLTLCNPMDCSPPGSSIYGIFQARVLEWGAIAFSAFSVYQI